MSSQQINISRTHRASLAFIATLLLSLPSFAGYGLTMEEGPTSSETAIDMDKNLVHINFKYKGCDPNPSADFEQGKMRFKMKCVNGKDYEYPIAGGGVDAPYRGDTGQVTLGYEYEGDKDKECAQADMEETMISATYPLEFFYGGVAEQCGPEYKPVALTFLDSPYKPKGKIRPEPKFMHRYKSIGKLCEIEPKKITLPGFGTDDSKMTQLEVKDNEFTFGGDTSFKFEPNPKDPSKGTWIPRYFIRDSYGNIIDRKKPSENFKLSTPIPIMFKRDGKIHLAATVQLKPDGTATILSQNPGKTYNNRNEAFKDKPYNFAEKTKGTIKIDMRPLRGNIRQTKVAAYDKDNKHLRTLNIVGRNLLGINSEAAWCGEENCFRRGVAPENRCENKKSGDINMARGGSDNLCYSCLGVTAGMCSAKSEEDLISYRDEFNKERDKAVTGGKKASAGAIAPRKKDAFEELFKRTAKTARENTGALACRKGFANDPNQQEKTGIKDSVMKYLKKYLKKKTVK